MKLKSLKIADRQADAEYDMFHFEIQAWGLELEKFNVFYNGKLIFIMIA
jgi:hypothetical protein